MGTVSFLGLGDAGFEPSKSIPDPSLDELGHRIATMGAGGLVLALTSGLAKMGNLWTYIYRGP
jgi:hypothetical protein